MIETKDPSAILFSLHQEIPWRTGYRLKSLLFTRKEDHWLVVVKVQKGERTPLVAFIDAHSPEDGLQMLWYCLTHKDSWLTWREDKFGS